MADPPVTFGVGVTDLTRLSKDLRAVSKDLQAGFRDTIKAAAEPVAEAARVNSSFSARIPGSIRVVASGGKANVRVAVRAGGAKAPEAAAFENQGKTGTFRHPVFGNRHVWVTQRAHPFLFPALTANAERVADRVTKAIDGYLSAHGL